MSKAILEAAAKQLEAGDSIQKTFLGFYTGKYGYLALSKKKLLFIMEEGLFKKNYRVLLETPFTAVKEHQVVNRETLRITDNTGKTHDFKTDIPANLVWQNLKNVLDTSRMIPA